MSSLTTEVKLTPREAEAKESVESLLTSLSEKLGVSKAATLKKGIHLLEAALKSNAHNTGSTDLPQDIQTTILRG